MTDKSDHLISVEFHNVLAKLSRDEFLDLDIEFLVPRQQKPVAAPIGSTFKAWCFSVSAPKLG